MCLRHWDMLRAEVDRQGLGGFVATTGEQAVSQAERQVEGEESIDSFEPLIGASFAIYAHVLSLLGIEALNISDVGEEYCPVCLIQQVHDDNCEEENCQANFDAWIEESVTEQRRIAESFKA